ncbi:type II toxin-antitoxin system Phd/YefM family antitoxin [Nonomuraea lactucae]|uniref:type II toxin-antitoxin system Phd/YefM family antitoxin n=1 Tax=Nonomuraea lactucae TaxID=2249762 RepID=UPI001F0584A5|nr:type II toxin-antitoxin system prevent-host-death family antitoxin [Nonomuraea lactucae]
MSIDEHGMETFGITAARDILGPLVSRAVHAHRPTVIKRSDDEHAVLISVADYEELLRARDEVEAGRIREAIAARERGEMRMHRYESRDQVYADLGLPTPGERS